MLHYFGVIFLKDFNQEGPIGLKVHGQFMLQFVDIGFNDDFALLDVGFNEDQPPLVRDAALKQDL